MGSGEAVDLRDGGPRFGGLDVRQACAAVNGEIAPLLAGRDAFDQTGIENGKIVGRMKPTGIRPKFIEKFESANIYLPPNIFGYNERYF